MTVAMTLDDKREILAHLRTILKPKAPSKAWAYRLRDREHRGERLSNAQRDAWRRALQGPAVLPEGSES